MEEITIYKFQHGKEGKICYDRQVRQAFQYTKNTFEGKKDVFVKHM